MTQLISTIAATLLLFVFGVAFVSCITSEQDSDGPIAASLIGLIFCALWLGSQVAALV